MLVWLRFVQRGSLCVRAYVYACVSMCVDEEKDRCAGGSFDDLPCTTIKHVEHIRGAFLLLRQWPVV